MIGDRLAEELAAALLLPPHRFDPCVIRPAAPVDKYQTVAFDNSRYSVPRPFAFEPVAVKGYVGTVAIVARGEVVATHTRSLHQHRMIIDPVHYLAILDRKPGVLDAAPAFRDWGLPACFAAFRAAWRSSTVRPGHTAVRARLATLRRAPLARVRQPVEECIDEHVIDAETVVQRTRRRAAIATRTSAVAELPASAAAADVQVPLPDLSRFDQLLGGHEDHAESHDESSITNDEDACIARTVGVLGNRTGCHDHHRIRPASPDGSGSFDLLGGTVTDGDVTMDLLKTRFRQLHWPTMGASWELARDAAAADQTFLEFLLRLTELELAARDAAPSRGRIEQAGFPMLKDSGTTTAGLPGLSSRRTWNDPARRIDQKFNGCDRRPGDGQDHIAMALGRRPSPGGEGEPYRGELVSELEKAQKQYRWIGCSASCSGTRC